MTITAELSAVSALDVTVPYTVSGTASDPADYTITASPVTITAGSTTATITITVVDDAIDELDETVIVTMGTPTNANKGAVGVHTATINDDDQAGVTIVESGGGTAVDEAGSTSDTYTLALASQPTADVTITVTPDGQSDLGAGAATAITLTFTPLDWNVAQTVTVSAVDDALLEGSHSSIIRHSSASVDPDYDGIQIAAIIASVQDNDTSPVFQVIPDQEAVEDEPFTVSDDAVQASGEGAGGSFALIVAPASMTIDPTSGAISWRPTNADVGQTHVTVTYDDVQGRQLTRGFVITVANRPPDLPATIPDQHAEPGKLFVLPDEAIQADDEGQGQAARYSLTEAPAGMSIDPLTGRVAWIPDVSQRGRHPVGIRFDDGHGGSATATFTVTVDVLEAAPPSGIGLDETDTDGDSVPDFQDGDIDGDGVPNALDNAVFTYNPDQSDADKDGLIDAIDADADDSGFRDDREGQPLGMLPPLPCGPMGLEIVLLAATCWVHVRYCAGGRGRIVPI